jgi:hypothetical protein
MAPRHGKPGRNSIIFEAAHPTISHIINIPYIEYSKHPAMAPRIGVFPASGGLGTSIVNHLIKLVSASQLVLITRNPDKWTNLGQAGATLRTADYDQPSTLDNAFDEVDVLMLISYASFEIKHRVEVRALTPRNRPFLTPTGASTGNPSRDRKRRETHFLLIPGFRRRSDRPQCSSCHGRTPRNGAVSR